MHLMSLLKAKAYSWAFFQAFGWSSHECKLPKCTVVTIFVSLIFEKYLQPLHILTNLSYLDRPFLSFTNSLWIHKPWIFWQTFCTLTNPAYLDKPFLSWQTFPNLTNPFISWQTLNSLTNLIYLDITNNTFHFAYLDFLGASILSIFWPLWNVRRAGMIIIIIAKQIMKLFQEA